MNGWEVGFWVALGAITLGFVGFILLAVWMGVSWWR